MPAPLLAPAALAAGKATLVAAGAGALRYAALRIADGGLFELGRQGMGWLLSQFGYDWDPDGPDPYPPSGDFEGNAAGGCWATDPTRPPGILTVEWVNGDKAPAGEVEQIYGWSYSLLPTGGVARNCASIQIRKPGSDQIITDEVCNNQNVDVYAVYLTLQGGSRCAGNGSDIPDGVVYPPPQYIENGDCTYKFELNNVVVDENNQPMGILYKAGPDDRELREGPITECNIEPTYIFIDATGGPDKTIDPIGPDGQEIPIDEIVKRIRNPVINAVNENTDAKLQQYFDERVPMLPGGAWTLQGVCETDEEGSLIEPQPTFRWEWGASSSSSMAAQQLLYMSDLIQQQLNFKHRTCKSSGPELRGQWVTTEWRSLEYSDSGNNVLRKRLRYRSIGDRTLESLVGFWENFAWEAGPVCVIHQGGWWGTPQVWAATEDEGKRVLRQAAENAGFDADAEGEWVVSASSGSRYGRSGTMNIAVINGSGTSWFAITARDGSNGRPDVLTT